MADLRRNATRMHELIVHIRGRENSINHFYLDNEGWVTIGVGYLVDSRDGGLAGRERVGRDFSRREHRFFSRPGGGGAVTSNDVFADWSRVRNGGQAQLRISLNGIDTLMALRLNHFIRTLYDRRPFVEILDEQIHMALVDARFNPSGIVLYGTGGDIGKMWKALDPASADKFNLREALRLFELIWQGRGGRNHARYQERHQLRVGMFRRGVEAMEYTLSAGTHATRAKRSPAYPGTNAGIIGVFPTQQEAEKEKCADRAWHHSWGWECWIVTKPTNALGAYVQDGSIVGVYTSRHDANLDLARIH